MKQEKETQRRKMWQEIDLFLEAFYPKGKDAGQKVAAVDMKISQVRGLENLVVSTRRFSEIVNFIKNQAGKQNKTAEKWRKVADFLLKQLDQLEAKAIELGGEDPESVLDAKLRLARGWVKQVMANYLFEQVKPELGRHA